MPNEHLSSRTGRARNDKDSILADAKNALKILYPALQRMPKIERIEGAPKEMRNALVNIIRDFSIAKECQEVRLDHIHRMFGEFGITLACFDLCISQGLLTDGAQLALAMQMERIEEGIRKWRSATRSLKSQERAQVGSMQEVTVRTNE